MNNSNEQCHEPVTTIDIANHHVMYMATEAGL
ncbi:hypothetical protein ACUW82_000995 [Staphylococcus lugdunensis]